ncbi:MAG: Holliday junction branch migration protein RuvA [Alistipes senegalensis]|nr:Holliday junction branch migration protein RuvA [Oxalobacter formigenes]MCM1280771.1 Holliday junction branch migration protein RuvA [Alistipes senegalensis]
MIARISGTLLQKAPPTILVDCQGIGYEIDVSMGTFYNLPSIGEKITLFTHLAVREDAHLLYGFASQEERDLFRQLIRISGIGARTALSLLSGMSVAEMVQAVTLQDTARFSRIPGIGKKTAERLLLELKGKLGANLEGAGSAAVQGDNMADILNALIALGYSSREANAAIRQIPADSTVSDGIKLALKSLSKG